MWLGDVNFEFFGDKLLKLFGACGKDDGLHTQTAV